MRVCQSGRDWMIWRVRRPVYIVVAAIAYISIRPIRTQTRPEIESDGISRNSKWRHDEYIIILPMGRGSTPGIEIDGSHTNGINSRPLWVWWAMVRSKNGKSHLSTLSEIICYQPQFTETSRIFLWNKGGEACLHTLSRNFFPTRYSYETSEGELFWRDNIA